MKPAASPASSRPSHGRPMASTASGPSTTGAATGLRRGEAVAKSGIGRRAPRASVLRRIAQRRIVRLPTASPGRRSSARRATARRRCSGRGGCAFRRARCVPARRPRSTRRSPSAWDAGGCRASPSPKASVERRPSAAMVTRRTNVSSSPTRDRPPRHRRSPPSETIARFALTPGSKTAPAADCLLEQRPVEVARGRSPGRAAVGVAGLHRDAAFARHEHAVDRQTVLDGASGEAEARSSASVPGLSVSPHSLSRGNRRDRSRRTRAPARARTVAATVPAGPAPTMRTSSSHDVTTRTLCTDHWRARLITSALFFDPNPRQLHSAASIDAGRAVVRDEIEVAGRIGIA